MDDLAKNQNRAHISPGARYNEMRPMNADDGVAGSVRGAGPNDLPPSIRPDQPLCVDPHARGRNSFDNLSVKPGEKSRAAESTETRRRLANPGKPTDPYR